VLWFPEGEQLVPHSGEQAAQISADENGVAAWVFRHKQPAGRNTDTLPGTSRYHLPLLQGDSVLGVFSVGFNDDGNPTREQQRLLASFVNQTTLAVDRIQLAEKARQAQILRETERLQTALLNSISHDLRTPLTSITGALSSLHDDDAFLDEAARRDLVDTALGEAERMNRLVNNLLDMTRLESGALKLVREPADVPDLIGVVLDQLGSRLHSHELALDLPDDLPLVSIDFVLMAQVLVNVIENAVKYSPAYTMIEISAGAEGESLLLQIRDRGIGIPAESLTRVFDKFYRVQEGDKSVGTGLGLSISKTIVEAHGGSIWLENRTDGGTIVNIRLPLQQPES
jgi:two-component system sensor histidine kinase KdpD